MAKLTHYQRESLAAWYEIGRHGTAGYYPGEFSERKPTLDKLYRLGLVERPHRGIGDWRAKVTKVGLAVAEECAAEFRVEHEENI